MKKIPILIESSLLPKDNEISLKTLNIRQERCRQRRISHARISLPVAVKQNEPPTRKFLRLNCAQDKIFIHTSLIFFF